MSTVLQLPIDLSSPGTQPGFPQFGSLQASGSGNDSSSGQQPFAALLASMSPGLSQGSTTVSESSSGNAAGNGGSSSDSSDLSALVSQLSLLGGQDIDQELHDILQYGSSKRSNTSQGGSAATSNKMSLYASLISLLMSLSKEAGNAGSTASDSGKQPVDGKSSSDLFAKISKELSSLLGVGLASTTTNSSTASGGSVSGTEVGTEASRGISDFVERLLKDPGVQSDLVKLVNASEGGSSQADYSAVFEDLISRMNKLESQSLANDAGKSNGQNLRTANSKSVEATSTAGAKVAGDATPSFTIGDLKELVNRVTDNSTGSNSALSAMNVRADSGKSVHELLQKLGNGTSPEPFSKSVSGVLDQSLEYASSLSAKTTARGGTSGLKARSASSSASGSASGAGSTHASSDNSAAAAGQMNLRDTGKTTSTKVLPSSGKETANSTNVSATLGKQDSTRSDNSQTRTMSGTLVDAFRSTTNGTGAASTFKQSLSAASQNSAGVADAKATPYQVSQTILRGVNMMNEGGKTVVTLKLQPESLGSVSLQVASDSGKISAQFNVGTLDARAALEASIPQMRQMLQTNGISLTHLSVNLTGGGSHSSHPQYQPRRQSTRFYNLIQTEKEEASRSFGYNTMEVKV